jgi:hypothetical protein
VRADTLVNAGGSLNNNFHLAALLIVLLLCWSGCGGSGPSFTPLPRALVVGQAGGTVLQAIQSQYMLTPGSGDEDPGPYRIIVYDGDNTTPQQLSSNPGAQKFLSAGKPVVILNATEDHLRTGLLNVAWAHAQSASPAVPAVAFLLRRDTNGVGQELVQVDFPQRMQAAPPGQQQLLPLTPPADQLLKDSRSWLAQLNAKAAGSANIDPATIGAGQAVLYFDHVKQFTITQSSVLNGQPPPYGTAWGVNGTQPPNFTTNGGGAFGGTFETLLYALLEGNSPATYQHKIIARQFLLVSPPAPLATQQVTTQFAITGSNWNGSWPVYSTLGFSSDFTLSLQLLLDSSTMGVTENLPQATNNVTQLTTSQQHTETVGLSVTSGAQNGNLLGTLSSSWSDSWTWGQARTVSFQNWQSQSSLDVANNFVSYQFQAFGGSDVTAAALYANLLQLPPSNEQIESQFVAPFNYFPPNGQFPQFNRLQISDMTNKSETEWATSTGQLIPPQLVQLVSNAVIDSGELLELTAGVRLPFKSFPNSVFTGYGQTRLYQVYNLNFAAPGLQPPGWQVSSQTQVVAPWTLSFPPWPDKIGLNQPITGTLSMPQEELNALNAAGQTILLTYVVEPLSTIQTLPAQEACPGNQFNFNPGANAVSNGSPPLQVPASSFVCNSGTCAAPIPLSFQTAQTNQYSVQVVAWLPQATINGQTVINPQSAWCLNVPETTIQ